MNGPDGINGFFIKLYLWTGVAVSLLFGGMIVWLVTK